jgi:hypothetical protein
MQGELAHPLSVKQQLTYHDGFLQTLRMTADALPCPRMGPGYRQLPGIQF